MASCNSAKECPICKDEYNERERCPRNLPCSHTLCSECIGNLISRNSKNCPFCLRAFHATAARGIGVNTSLLDVLKLLREMELKIPVPPVASPGTPSNRLNDIKRETEENIRKILDSFQEADEEIDQNLQGSDHLISYFSQANDTLKNEILLPINETMAQNVNRVTYLKEYRRRLKLQKEVINERRKEVTETRTKLASSSTFTQVGPLVDQVGSFQTDGEDTIRNFKGCMSEDEKTRLKLEKVSKTMKDQIEKLKETVKSRGRNDEYNFTPDFQHMKIPKEMKITRSIPQEVTIESFQTRSRSVMELMKQNQLFAVQEFEGRRRFDQISLQEKNRIVLHHLKEQEIPSNAHCLKHNDVLKLINVSSRLVFLELRSEEKNKTLGKLYIRLSPGGKRAHQFALLCSGQNGPSYVNTNILRVYDKGNIYECVYCGDYENLGGKGGRALVHNTWKEKGGVFKPPLLAGTVFGCWSNVDEADAVQFFINTRDYPGREDDFCFGMVEEGLPILRDAIYNHRNIKSVIFSDAGLVLDI